MQPSSPGYSFSTADLRGFNITAEQAAQILLAASPQGGGNDPTTALLAAILRNMRRLNCRVQPFPWSLGTWFRQQVLNDNPLRAHLLIQNVGSGDLMVVHEGANASPQDMTSAAGQNELTVQQTRALRVVAGGYYEPLVVPTNPITLFTIGVASNGVVIEGQ